MILIIYLLCSLTSLACAVLLHLGARRSGSRMLFWCGLCFSVMAVANVLVIVDHYVLTDVALWPARYGANLLAVSLLLYGLIFEER